MEQRAAIKFCVKLKKMATETLEMLQMCAVRTVYLEQVAQRVQLLQGRRTNGSLQKDLARDGTYEWLGC
jgi:hypothetical protein